MSQQEKSSPTVAVAAAPSLKNQFVYFLHLFLTVGSWFAPFLVRWDWLLPAYGLVMLQFILFDRCLMNGEHDLTEADNNTFYSHLLTRVGIEHNKKTVKQFVRSYLYYLLTGLTVLWQWVFGQEPLWF